MIPVSAAILQDSKGRVLVTQRPERGAQPLKWEFPGGKIRDGESPEECLRRELDEELGIETEVGEIFHAVNHRYAEHSILLLAYLCRWYPGGLQLRYHRDFRWVEPHELEAFDLAEADRFVARELVRRYMCAARNDRNKIEPKPHR